MGKYKMTYLLVYKPDLLILNKGDKKRIEFIYNDSQHYKGYDSYEIMTEQQFKELHWEF